MGTLVREALNLPANVFCFRAKLFLRGMATFWLQHSAAQRRTKCTPNVSVSSPSVGLRLRFPSKNRYGSVFVPGETPSQFIRSTSDHHGLLV